MVSSCGSATNTTEEALVVKRIKKFVQRRLVETFPAHLVPEIGGDLKPGACLVTVFRNGQELFGQGHMPIGVVNSLPRCPSAGSTVVFHCTVNLWEYPDGHKEIEYLPGNWKDTPPTYH